MTKNSDIVFVRIPKNASTSVYEALREKNLVQRKLPNFYDMVFNSAYCRNFFCPSHQSYYALTRLIGDQVRQARSFAIIRNPFDRLVSMYSFMKKHSIHELYGKDPMSFKEFLMFICARKDDPTFFHAHSQRSWVVDEKNQIAVDSVLRFDRLKEDFSVLMKKWGLPEVELPCKNSTKHKPFSEFFDRSLSNFVFYHYQEDFKLWD